MLLFFWALWVSMLKLVILLSFLELELGYFDIGNILLFLFFLCLLVLWILTNLRVAWRQSCGA